MAELVSQEGGLQKQCPLFYKTQRNLSQLFHGAKLTKLPACSLQVVSQEDESSVVLDAITTGIGLAPFFGSLEGLFSCEEFQIALHGPKTPKGQSRNGQHSQQSSKEGSQPFHLLLSQHS